MLATPAMIKAAMRQICLYCVQLQIPSERYGGVFRMIEGIVVDFQGFAEGFNPRGGENETVVLKV